MNDLMSHAWGWLESARENPAITAVVVLVSVGFWYLSTWKPKATRQAESRLSEIRDESHDFYRHQRPPGR